MVLKMKQMSALFTVNKQLSTHKNSQRYRKKRHSKLVPFSPTTKRNKTKQITKPTNQPNKQTKKTKIKRPLPPQKENLKEEVTAKHCSEIMTEDATQFAGKNNNGPHVQTKEDPKIKQLEGKRQDLRDKENKCERGKVQSAELHTSEILKRLQKIVMNTALILISVTSALKFLGSEQIYVDLSFRWSRVR